MGDSAGVPARPRSPGPLPRAAWAWRLRLGLFLAFLYIGTARCSELGVDSPGTLQRGRTAEISLLTPHALHAPMKQTAQPNQVSAAVPFNPPRMDRSQRTWQQGWGGKDRSLVDETTQNEPSTASMFWWDNSDYSYVQASGLCSSYGGVLAVLAPDPGIPSNLQSGVDYWIGLFNSAQLPGVDGAWTWVDQASYGNSTRMWAEGQPDGAGQWCVYVAWEAGSASWRWFSGDCTSNKAVLCSLPSSGSASSILPFSCVQGMSISSGAVYNSTTIEDNDVSQYSQLCAALCRADSRCDAFRLTDSLCELQERPTGQAVDLTVDPAIVVSCMRYGLDFVNLGRTVATTNLDGAPVASNYKCMTDYRINLYVAQTEQGVCSAADCANLCGSTSWDDGATPCTAFLHCRSRCRCQLGASPLYGLNVSVGLYSGSGYLACMRSDADWLRFGALNDPSTVSASLGNRVFTLHPERLGYDAASTVCRTQSPFGGTLASLGALPEALLVATRLLLNQAPRLMTPLPGEEPGMYGTWVGLASNGSRLRGLLDNTPGSSTQGMTWDDGSSVNRTLLQVLWSVHPDGSMASVPDDSGGRVCLYLSNSTGLMRPGLAAAGACNWELPFVCESSLSLPPSVPPPPSPGKQTPVIALALNVNQLTSSSPTSPSVGVLTGQPTILTAPDTGVMMWVQPANDRPTPQKQARDWCGIWNASLATVYNATAQVALTSAATELQAPYWINLAVNRSTDEWAWGAPNTPLNSTTYLDGFQGWCGDMPDTDQGTNCAQLAFSPGVCPDPGWGWIARNCSDTGSYMCMASPRGNPGRFFCADGYDLGGTVVGATHFVGATPKEAASYCSDLCTSQAACHAFTVTGSVCIRKSRNATSLASDIVRANVTVGCFKYGILWDMLGGQVAVQTRVAADATTRFRCVRFQDVARTNLQQMNINSCRVSDCTAMCFATRSCQVAVFDHTSCECTLARSPLKGSDGTNAFRDGITTCLYDEDNSFLGLGLVRSAFYITPPVDGSTPAGSTGDWLGGGNNGGTNTDSGTIDDINFVPSGNNPGSPPATNPSDPNKGPQPPAPVPQPPAPPPAPPTPLNATIPPPVPLAPAPADPTTVPDSPDSNSPRVPSPPPRPRPPPPVVAASGGGSSFGLTQMIGITAGFCGSVLLLLGGAAVIIMRRRKAAAALRLEKERKGGSDKDPRVNSQLALSAVKAARLSPDLERAITSYIEAWGAGSSGSGSSPRGSPSTTALTLAQAAELESVIRREQSAEGALEPDALIALEQLLHNMQNPGGASGSGIMGEARSRPSYDGAAGGGTRISENGIRSPDGGSRAGSSGGAKLQGSNRSSNQPLTATTATAPSSTHILGLGGEDKALLALGQDALNAMVSKSGICSSYITLSRLLGAGSFGTVYEGTWRRQTVAVKIIPHSPSAAPRVKNEVELSMQFDHPNVVRSYFYETFDARAMSHMAQMEAKTAQRESQETWIVLEYCSEGSLASRLYAHASNNAGEEVMVPRPLHERDPCIASMEGILEIAQGVAQGMAYMHSLSICHGDLKCENVLLGSILAAGGGGSGSSSPARQVQAKVGDFGLSRAIGDVSSHLSTATVGTVTHMPPELLLSGRLRPSCDVYSFGIMLWQLYTGAVPYAGMRYAEIVYKVAVCNLRPMFPVDTPQVYKELAEACWQSDAGARPSFEQVICKLSELRDQVALLESERLRSLHPHSDSASLSSTSTDITLLSPWIGACPNPGSSGIPANPAHLAWAADLINAAAGVQGSGSGGGAAAGKARSADGAGPGSEYGLGVSGSAGAGAAASGTSQRRSPNSPLLSAAAVSFALDDSVQFAPAILSALGQQQQHGSSAAGSRSAQQSIDGQGLLAQRYGSDFTIQQQQRVGSASSTPPLATPRHATPRLSSQQQQHMSLPTTSQQAHSLPPTSSRTTDPNTTISLTLPPPPPVLMASSPQSGAVPRPYLGQPWAHHSSAYTSPRDSATILSGSHGGVDGAADPTHIPHSQHDANDWYPSSGSGQPLQQVPLGSQQPPPPVLLLEPYRSLPRPIPLLQPQRGPPPRQHSFQLPDGSTNGPQLHQPQSQFPLVPAAVPAGSQPHQPQQYPPVQQVALPPAGATPSSRHGSRSRSRTAVLPGGVEAHVALRAHATSQVVMGIHALNLGSAHSSNGIMGGVGSGSSSAALNVGSGSSSTPMGAGSVGSGALSNTSAPPRPPGSGALGGKRPESAASDA